MSFIGNVPAEAYSPVAKDTFSGNGSTTDFTLSIPATTNSVNVYVENVAQEPTTAYTISGTTLSFTAAPTSGTNNIYVIHRGPAVQTVVPPGDSITTAMIQDDAVTAAKIAVTGNGTSGQALTSDGDGTMSWTTLSADKIEEGNSSVEVVDTGTGYVAVTVDGTETARFVAGGDFNFNSGFGSVATAYGCRAWVNFNGTGTVAINESGNVSSITDNGTGNYTVNFTTAMPDANYSVVGSFAWGNNGNQFLPDLLATSTCGVLVLAGNTFYDSNQVNVAIFR